MSLGQEPRQLALGASVLGRGVDLGLGASEASVLGLERGDALIELGDSESRGAYGVRYLRSEL